MLIGILKRKSKHWNEISNNYLYEYNDIKNQRKHFTRLVEYRYLVDIFNSKVINHWLMKFASLSNRYFLLILLYFVEKF